ncbi:unnamed protein product [Vitrella brassicaformis CCMP3155]|uniref:Uncharacterized protein n=1 Tax=Vitrella brassicaformis (strain CCMP3155) TaxID=1169540 RepID=A0A0G4GU27_VITBC|nr:unnamed protein product [Vitrella brassicaformis CCMP3155]|eukprot:CEM34197.1 unnamed protein product [Vitrella brassicaformis CCMP3155]
MGDSHSRFWQSSYNDAYKPHPQRSADFLQNRQNRLYLRSHHFELGNKKPVYESTLKQDFPPLQSEKDGVKKLQEAAAKKRELSAVHWSLGDVNKAPAREWGTIRNSTIDSAICRAMKEKGRGELHEDVKRDLRKEHFELGFDPTEYETTAQSGCAVKMGGAGAEREEGVMSSKERARLLRSCNFDLGGHSTVYKTTAQELHGCEKTMAGAQAKEEMKQLKRDLLWTKNISFGSLPCLYQSTAAHQFGDIDAYLDAARRPASLNKELKGDLRAVHFYLGEQVPPSKSLFRETFKPFDIPEEEQRRARQEIQELKKDLRLPHFSLKHSACVPFAPNESTSQAAYKKVDAAYYKAMPSGAEKRAQIDELRKAHFSLADETVLADKTLNDQRQMSLQREQELRTLKGVNYSSVGKQDMSRIKADLRAVHFEFGDAARPKESLARASYKPFPGSRPATLADAVKKDLRAHHFEIGANGYLGVRSEAHDGLQWRGFAPVEFRDDLKRELRAVHWSCGDESLPKDTTSRAAYIWHKLPIEEEEDDEDFVD